MSSKKKKSTKNKDKTKNKTKGDDEVINENLTIMKARGFGAWLMFTILWFLTCLMITRDALWKGKVVTTGIQGKGALSFSTWVIIGILCGLSIATDIHLLYNMTIGKDPDEKDSVDKARKNQIDILVMAMSVISIFISFSYLNRNYSLVLLLLMVTVNYGKVFTLIYQAVGTSKNEELVNNLWAGLTFNFIIFIILSFQLSPNWGKLTSFDLSEFSLINM